MAKHDRRKTSGQPPSSRPVTIQVPLPVLGVVNGVREAFHGLCIATGLHVLEAMMESDREILCGPKGAPSGRAARVAGRECRQPGDARRAADRVTAAPSAERRRRSTPGELPMGGGHRPSGRAHAGRGRRRGVDAPVCGHCQRSFKIPPPTVIENSPTPG